jgi:hypothetical protein
VTERAEGEYNSRMKGGNSNSVIPASHGTCFRGLNIVADMNTTFSCDDMGIFLFYTLTIPTSRITEAFVQGEPDLHVT